MQFDPEQSNVRDVYSKMVQLITPRPIAWVSTVNDAGHANLAPFSFFNGIGANPPSLAFAPVNRRDGTKKDSLLNIEANGEFVVSVVSYDHREAMNMTSAEFDSEINEFDRCGIEAAPSLKVRPPRVANARAAFECRAIQTLNLGEGPLGANLVIGRIVMIHINDQLFDAEGNVDPGLLDTIGRLGGEAYSRTTDRFHLKRPVATNRPAANGV